jgi:hypothetical protein
MGFETEIIGWLSDGFPRRNGKRLLYYRIDIRGFSEEM